MSGVLLPNSTRPEAGLHGGLWSRAKAFAWSSRAFLTLVIAPTLVFAIYLGLFASNQYESSADFVVRRADAAKSPVDVGQLLGFSLGSDGSEGDASIVQAYLLSHDAVARLRSENDLVGVFTRDGTDWLSRLWFASPTPERLLTYYRKMVTVRADEETGITHLTVHAFRPADAQTLATKLLVMGEQQVNAINQRTSLDQIASAQRAYDEASHELNTIEAELTAYRQIHKDVDPADTGKAQVTMVAGLTPNLVAARARLNAMHGVISESSPQYRAMERQVRTLEAQVNGQSAKIVGDDHSIANRLGDYDKLVIRRQEVAQVYAVAAGQLTQAKEEAKRKKLYLIRVVEPNLPVKSEFPQRGQLILTLFGALVFAYAIGWLLLAGVKEHGL
ncbi:lipopolysaccharide biosynthesis protein [Novosphingobium sp. FSW06-99]|nr:lipopolysaccharide biosynthesis protein [Novosphingobium sp. FSW06-99]